MDTDEGKIMMTALALLSFFSPLFFGEPWLWGLSWLPAVVVMVATAK